MYTGLCSCQVLDYCSLCSSTMKSINSFLENSNTRLSLYVLYENPIFSPSFFNVKSGSLLSPRVTSPEYSYDPRQPHFKIPRKVVKGGSHICAPNYCLRYRPRPRQPQMIDTGMTHIGFRCTIRIT